MSFADSYRNRLGREGSNDGEAIFNHTADLANKDFANAPNFKVVTIDGIAVDSRVLEGTTWEDRTLLFRPKTKVDLGSIVVFDSTTWMITDALTTSISPKALLKPCNHILKWKDKSNVLHNVPTFVTASKSTKYDIKPNALSVDLLAGSIYINVKRTSETQTIAISQRFIIGSSIYDIAGIDDVTNIGLNGEGYIQFSCNFTTANQADDFVNGIADNSVLYNSKDGVQGGSGSLW